MVNTIDEHAPMKKRNFMNKTLRSAVYKKRMTHNKFSKDKSNKNWVSFLFSFIIFIFGCSSADKFLSLPISFATFMKKLLKLFAT
jgi:hypothetical protein